MRRLHPENQASRIAENAIMITGAARSGTTMLGKLVHSLETVEYAFEPATFVALFAMIRTMDEWQWRLLYDTYLCEEIMCSHLAGRGFNTNEADDSFIGNVKSEGLIRSRLTSSLRRSRALEAANGHRAAFKIPDFVSSLPTFRAYYPRASIIVTARDHAGVILSTLGKGWYSDHDLHERSGFWPYYLHEGLRIPPWVPENEWDDFIGMSEKERCCLQYCAMYEYLPDDDGFKLLHYDLFLQRPTEIFRQLADWLGLAFGAKTQALLGNVVEPGTSREIDLSDIPSKLRARVLDATLYVRERAQRAFS